MRFAACFVRSEYICPNDRDAQCREDVHDWSIRSRFVKPLLQCGYTVNASVHDPSTFSILSFLFSFEVGSL
ncbi:hypothetical protein EUGRSUZ_E02510 [Eucalyptus grandis]|uniref:Uncharacterized protein n=2 Tax=Eucalyptus grandis TaxID=71139 RepID=A0ACC3KWD9_EUCGR|nr:hypothetical protein EUGRSUZ_E02510 [Eucalyptus grandis]